MKEDYIFPFLWMRDQTEETLRTEMEKIRECGIRSVCVESRPHPDFGGEGWWRDMDIILDEAKKHDMHVWILDDAHFPTGQANGQIPARHPELARKYAMMQHTDCVGPVPAASLDVNLMMTKAFTWVDFGKKIEKPLIDRQELLGVMAYPVVEGGYPPAGRGGCDRAGEGRASALGRAGRRVADLCDVYDIRFWRAKRVHQLHRSGFRASASGHTAGISV